MLGVAMRRDRHRARRTVRRCARAVTDEHAAEQPTLTRADDQQIHGALLGQRMQAATDRQRRDAHQLRDRAGRVALASEQSLGLLAGFRGSKVEIHPLRSRP